MVKKITFSFLFIFFIFFLFSQNRKLRKDYDLLKNNQFEEAYTNLSDIRNKEMYTPFSYFLFSEYFGNINNKKYNIDSCFWYLKKSYTLSKSYIDKKELEDACEDIKFCILKLNNKLDSIADFAYQKKYSTTNNLNDLNYFISFYTETKSNIKAKERLDMLLFNNAKSKKSIQSLEKFIQDYPQSQFLDSSKLEIEKLEYNDVIIKNDVVSFDQFLKKYPNSTFKTEINKKKQKKIFDTYLLMNKENEFNIYIEKYPDSDFIAEAKKKRDLLVYEESLLKNTIDGYSSVLTKYPDIEYAEKIRYNIKKLDTITTEENVKSNEVIETESGLSLVVTGQGQTLLEAKQNAISSAIEQAYGAFISTKTEIFNDKIVSDEMTSISSGNIKSFEIISESKQFDSTYAVILKVIVSVDKLTSFVKSKGVTIDVKGGLFALNIRQQLLNEKAEVIAISDMVRLLHEPYQNSNDYLIKNSEPKSLDSESKEWEIQLYITAKCNKNIDFFNNHIINTLKSFSLTSSEVENYKTLNKQIFPIKIIHDSILYVFYMRNIKSINILNSFLNKKDFYTRLFTVSTNLDESNGVDKSKFENMNLINKYDDVYEIEEESQVKSKYRPHIKNENSEYELTFKLISSGHTSAKYNWKDKRSLSELEKMTSYIIKPRGIVLPVKLGGVVVNEKDGHGLVAAIQTFDDTEWEEAKNFCNVLELNGFNDWYLPSSEELLLIYNKLKEINVNSFYEDQYWSNVVGFDHYNNVSWAELVDFSSGKKNRDAQWNKNSLLIVRKF